MADADARATARRHTAQLLKMLRGYGPAAEPEPVPEPLTTVPNPALVAEATPVYGRSVAAVPTPPPLPVVQVAPPALPSCRGDESSSIPTAGEILRRSHGKLGQLMAQAGRLARLREVFRAYLPPYLHDHAVLVRLDAQGWEVQTDSASWATRLRYALPTIGQVLGQQLGIALPKPRIRVVPAAAPAQPQRPRLTLTRRNAELLEATARTLTDPQLGAALRRLAAHGRSGAAPKA